MSGQLHTKGALPPQKEAPATTWMEGEWAPEPV